MAVLTQVWVLANHASFSDLIKDAEDGEDEDEEEEKQEDFAEAVSDPGLLNQRSSFFLCPEFLVANQDPESGERRFGGSVNLPPAGFSPPIEEVGSPTSIAEEAVGLKAAKVAAVGLGAATVVVLLEQAEDNQNASSLFNCSGH